ncbi:NifB/NifX family molybdenum-iron cluster-binding protein [bacterium]|nr:NifB/NifX family molybdenum-iron cluster-binding protein [bacterium]
MKIALTAKGTEWNSPIDARFGRTEYFVIYDEEKDELNAVDNTSVINEAHGAGPRTSQKLFEEEANVLITGNGPGGNAAAVLKEAGIEVYVGAGGMSVKEAYDAYKKGDLKMF